jgi:hypothetical protein
VTLWTFRSWPVILVGKKEEKNLFINSKSTKKQPEISKLNW